MPGSVGILTERSARDEHTANTLIIFVGRIGIEMKHEETIYHLRHRVCLRTHHMANINNYLCGLARQYRPVFDSGSIIVIVCEEWGPVAVGNNMFETSIRVSARKQSKTNHTIIYTPIVIMGS